MFLYWLLWYLKMVTTIIILFYTSASYFELPVFPEQTYGRNVSTRSYTLFMMTIRNELDKSHNPYLLQHKDNPVAWRVWGQEAFEEARRRNVPLLISIGYSTCHWCHVMAHEVFEDDETASVMNDLLVCIKVDREEHPEVDEVYMEACQAMNGNGGWPLNVFTDLDGKPFYAATYVPREGWKNLIINVSQAWEESPADIKNFAAQLAVTLQESESKNKSGNRNLKTSLFSFLTEYFDKQDPDFSGRGRAPRFPSHTLYYFLLGLRDIPAQIASMLEQILEAIQDSGLHDRVGGGFHRYSTDAEWRVPHFEKMLYDNAQMLLTYSLAASRFNRPDFLETAESTARYLIRDMAVYENGQFYGFASAEDADDPKGEGSFYAWTRQGLIDVLGEEQGRKLAREWNITSNSSDIHGVFPFRIPHPRASDIFRRLSTEEKAALRLEWTAYHTLLLDKRQQRPRPFRDTKVLTDWNALSLMGLSVLYAHAPKDEYQNVIDHLASMIIGRFRENHLERMPGKSGHITDYGHASLALFTAWEVTGNEQYLSVAETLVKAAVEKFVDASGAVFTSDNDFVFMRFEEKFDHSQPAGTHSLLSAWTRIHALGKLDEYEPLMKIVFERRCKMVSQIPMMVPSFLQALYEYKEGPVTLSVPLHFRDFAPDLLKWVGTEIRLISAQENDSFQLCEKDRCLLPVKLPSELNLNFLW
jgi:uncharacterized protein